MSKTNEWASWLAFPWDSIVHLPLRDLDFVGPTRPMNIRKDGFCYPVEYCRDSRCYYSTGPAWKAPA